MPLSDPMPAASPSSRREGFLVGTVVGAALAAATTGVTDAAEVRRTMANGEVVPLVPSPGRRRAATALGDGLLVELTSGGVDLRRLAGRWVDWRRDDGLEVNPLLALALDHLRDFDAPITTLPSGSVAAMAAALPAALASASPKAMLSGAFHVARMLDPAETTALAAVALVLAGAAFLEGRRDFIPDVVAALRANAAPPELLEVMRSIPRDPQGVPPVPRSEHPDPVATAVWLLWMAHHRPRGADALRQMAAGGGISATVGGLAGALFGARDGIGSWPAGWTNGAGEEATLRAALARRLGE